MLDEERDKLAEYLDKQTTSITKSSRLSVSRQTKSNQTLNQTTKIDFSSTDDSRNLDTTKSQVNGKVSSFYVPSTETNYAEKGRKSSTKLVRMKRLKKKVSDQQKLIKMLVTWIKIYYERDQSHTGKSVPHSNQQL